MDSVHSLPANIRGDLSLLILIHLKKNIHVLSNPNFAEASHDWLSEYGHTTRLMIEQALEALCHV